MIWIEINGIYTNLEKLFMIEVVEFKNAGRSDQDGIYIVGFRENGMQCNMSERFLTLEEADEELRSVMSMIGYIVPFEDKR
jgi:hypothetical protein